MKREGEFRHKRSLGQNFITDDGLFAELAALSCVGKEDRVLEIGAGAGGLTKALAERCREVRAIEVDGTLLPILRVALERYPNASVIHGDVMRLNLKELTADWPDFHVVANIPYYLTTDLMTMLLKSDLPIRSLSVMVQKEAAERLIAGPGEEGYGMLAVRAQYGYEPRIALHVPAHMFTPPPKVDSAFVVMPRREMPAVRPQDEETFFRAAAAAFAMRRKTMENNLIAAFHVPREQAGRWLHQCGFPQNVRGETLSLQDFAALSDVISSS